MLPVISQVALAPLAHGGGPLGNRFHVVALAFQRARQLKAGARPRVEAGNHKAVTLALLEVLADTVSWSVS
jgi:DNA-directed RNA polymerase omega subunit